MSTKPAFDDALVTRPYKHDIDKRDRRALSEQLLVFEDAPDIYRVYSEAGKEYMVDTRRPACTCPDFQYHEATCKHIRRARIEAGEYDLTTLDGQIQETIDTLDDQLDNLAAQRAELISLQRALDQFTEDEGCIS